MTGGKANAALEVELEDLRATHGDAVSISETGGAVESLLATMKGDLVAADVTLYSEMESLARYIHAAKAEITALCPDEVKAEYLPTAADELDAIVAVTADATHTIMDAAEKLDEVIERLDGEAQETVMTTTTQIYKACGFQDITGQRIGKVIKALKDIETKVDALVAAFGDEIADYKPQQQPRDSGKDRLLSDADLLEGLQLEGKGRTQAEIDALLGDFD
jgi:chemotaxis protein CheZ